MIEDIRKEIDAVDKELVALFERRMLLSKQVAEYKMDKGLPIRNLEREQSLIERNCSLLQTTNLRPFYLDFEHKIIELSCLYQQQLFDSKD